MYIVRERESKEKVVERESDGYVGLCTLIMKSVEKTQATRHILVG